MNIFTVSFFGHRMIDRPFLIEQRLESLIRRLINTKEYVDFIVGRSGDFDQYASSAVVDRSDLVVCCVERESGGAWQTVKYALEQGKTVINLANEDESESVNLL